MKDLALLLVRLVAGGTLVAHGYTKLFGGPGRAAPPALTRLYGPNFAKAVERGGPQATAQMLANLQVPYPMAGAYLSGLAEFGGGIALITGTFTRLAALAILVNMATAIGTVHWKTGFYGEGGWEFPVQLLTAAAALFVAGPGAISVDGVWSAAHKTAATVQRGAQTAAGAVQAGGDTLLERLNVG